MPGCATSSSKSHPHHVRVILTTSESSSWAMWPGRADGQLGCMTSPAAGPCAEPYVARDAVRGASPDTAPTRVGPRGGTSDVPPRSARTFSTSAALSALALMVSGSSVTVLVTRPAWVVPQVVEAILTSSVAMVPTLLFGAVLSLIRPSLRGSPAAHVGALVVAVLGYALLAGAGRSIIVAFDAADGGVEPSPLARLLPYLGIGSLLLIWTSLTIVGLLLGPTDVRPARRVVAVASTSLALTLTTMACAINPVAQAMIAAAMLAIVVILSRTARITPSGTRRGSPDGSHQPSISLSESHRPSIPPSSTRVPSIPPGTTRLAE